MIFYRMKNCPGCAAIEETLNDLAIAYKSAVLDDKNEMPVELSGQKLPLLVDEDEVIQGSHNIIDHLTKVTEFKKQWYKYQSDACYCDEE